MIVKLLLVERVVAVLALNPWNYGMTLALMVGQTCLGQGLEGAARVVAVQCSLRVDESLFAMMLLIFTTFLIVSSFYIETLDTALDGGAPRVALLACSLQVPDRLHCFAHAHTHLSTFLYCVEQLLLRCRPDPFPISSSTSWSIA